MMDSPLAAGVDAHFFVRECIDAHSIAARRARVVFGTLSLNRVE